MNNHLGVPEKIRSALGKSSFDALLLFGWDNVTYASGFSLPFFPYRYEQKIAFFLAKGGDFHCICPNEITSTIKQLGFDGCLSGYTLLGDDVEGLLSSLSEIIAGAGQKIATIGCDFCRVSQGLFERLQDHTKQNIQWQDASQWVIDLRKIKTDQELALLSEVAFRTDHGINGHFHHIMGARPVGLMGLAENVRVHCMERFLDEAGYNNVARVLDCEPSNRLFPYCENHGFNFGYSQTKKTQTGKMYPVSMTASKNGYYSDACRILSYGIPDDEQYEDYRKINLLRTFLLENIKPGIRCDELVNRTKQYAAENYIDLVSGIALGHGIGVTANEAPYLSDDNAEVFISGMVLVLDQLIKGKENQVLRSKDTVIVTEHGCDLVNWWKDWREPYIPIPFL